MQFIDFFITTHNSTTNRVIETILTQLVESGHVKSWKTASDGTTLHWSVTGSWAAYSTVSAIDKKMATGLEKISFSLEHFEED